MGKNKEKKKKVNEKSTSKPCWFEQEEGNLKKNVHLSHTGVLLSRSFIRKKLELF